MRAADFISHLRLELEYLMNLEYMVASISLTIYKSILDLISLSDRKKKGRKSNSNNSLSVGRTCSVICAYDGEPGNMYLEFNPWSFTYSRENHLTLGDIKRTPNPNTQWSCGTI